MNLMHIFNKKYGLTCAFISIVNDVTDKTLYLIGADKNSSTVHINKCQNKDFKSGTYFSIMQFEIV